jgi:hypothetical protein
MLGSKFSAVEFLKSREEAIRISCPRNRGYRQGEQEEYIKLCESIAGYIKSSELPEETAFIIDNDGCEVVVLIKGKEVLLHRIYYDYFMPPNCRGTCGGYCHQYFLRFEGSLRAVESFFK